MASFNGSDYDYLFVLGRKLYNDDSQTTRRAIATQLMAMAKSVRGQQIGWPNIARRYRHLTEYPLTETSPILSLPKKIK
jgi:hypothetical protein